MDRLSRHVNAQKCAVYLRGCGVVVSARTEHAWRNKERAKRSTRRRRHDWSPNARQQGLIDLVTEHPGSTLATLWRDVDEQFTTLQALQSQLIRLRTRGVLMARKGPRGWLYWYAVPL